MSAFRPIFTPLLLCAILAACGGSDTTGPRERAITLSVLTGSGQFGTAGNLLADPLTVVAIDAATDESVQGVAVEWRIVGGDGAVLSSQMVSTNARGFASAELRLGNSLGTYTVEVHAAAMQGPPARFTARAVAVPEITQITPAPAPAGGAVTITGRNFSPIPSENTVFFDDARALVTAATATTLSVVVPPCVRGFVDVRAQLGHVASDPAELLTTSADLAPLQLAVGESRVFSGAADLSCVVLPGNQSYLIVPQNADDHWGSFFNYIASTASTPPTTATRAAPQRSFASDFELTLRQREAEFGPAADAPAAQARTRQPEIGERRQFNVINSQNGFDEVTAEVRVLSQHAIIYVDVAAPSGGFTDADLTAFGALFDDPIHTTVTSVFGTPSDIDSNDRIAILFTPRVNALTPRNAPSYVTGYFYGCDLVARNRCSGSNGAEVFYALVPDPNGTFGDRRTATDVLRNVPGVLAHEYQHMINFSARNGSLDALWLAEALAHAAEESVGAEFERRGDITRAASFRSPNYARAREYLRTTAHTSLLGIESPGSVEFRGGAWLFVHYLQQHYGGDALLRALTASSDDGVANVTARTGQAWSTLLADFALACFAHGHPAFDNSALSARHTFGAFDLKQAANRTAAASAVVTNLVPPEFRRTGTLEAASHVYYETTPTSAEPLRLNLSTAPGSVIDADAHTQLVLLRIR